jgi:hypothetical protein
MEIKSIEGMSDEQINHEIQRGGRFVVYSYCISVILMTFQRSSPVYFIRSDENALTKGLPYTLLSLLAGWWGVPWGPIYTIGAVITNCRGGKDITEEILTPPLEGESA